MIKCKKTDKTLIVIIICSFAIISYKAYLNKQIEPVIDTETYPTTEPTNSVPELVYETCNDKSVGDSCMFKIGEKEYDGQCYDISNRMTCGPTQENKDQFTVEALMEEEE